MKRQALVLVLGWGFLVGAAEPADAPVDPSGSPWRFGLHARFGAQLPRTMGIAGLEVRAGKEVQGRLALVFGLSVSGGFVFDTACTQCGSGPNSRTTTTLLWASVLLEYTWLDKLLFLAAGPAVAYGSWAGTIGPSQGVEVNGAMGGLDLRLGVTLGPFDPSHGGRYGLTLALGAMVVLGEGRYYQPGLEGRDGVYTGAGLAWGLQPAVILGYDLR